MKLKLILIASLFLAINGANAQVIDVEGKIKSKVINRADAKVDQGIDKGLDQIEKDISDSYKEGDENESDAEKAPEDKTKQTGKNKSGESKNTETAKSPKQETPKLESYTKYDFVPGDQVLLFEDFSQDEIGDFPALWTTSGSGEVRTLNNYPGKWLYMNAEDKIYALMKDLNLPENFILEFDIIAAPKDPDYEHSSFELTLYQDNGEYLNDALYPGSGGVHFDIADDRWQVRGYKEDAEKILEGMTEISPIDVNKNNHIIIWVQKRRARIYFKGQKVLDLPTVMYNDIKYNRLRFSLWGQQGLPYVTNICLTSAAPDMRSKLLTEGKLVSYGIYFDVNKDVVKPESYGSLNEIAKVLKENPDVKIKVVGHTDGDGDAAKNLDLSKRRAASVKTELTKTFGIDAGRIETDGAGESQPVAGNDTPENKAKNRRVEFIKL